MQILVLFMWKLLYSLWMCTYSLLNFIWYLGSLKSTWFSWVSPYCLFISKLATSCSFNMVFSFIHDKILAELQVSIWSFVYSFRMFVSITSARGDLSFICSMSVVADKVELAVSGLFYGTWVCFCLFVYVFEHSERNRMLTFLTFYFSLANLSSMTVFVPEVSRSHREEDKMPLGQNVRVTL